MAGRRAAVGAATAMRESRVLSSGAPSFAIRLCVLLSRFYKNTSMQLPVNFDSVSLDGLLSDWVGALREFSVEAVCVLGPDPFGSSDEREVVAVHPPIVASRQSVEK